MTLEVYLKQNPKKYLIFDLDCTLARLEIGWQNVHQTLFEEVQIIDPTLAIRPPQNAHEFFTLIGKTAKKYGPQAKHALDIGREQYETAHYHGYKAHPSLVAFIKANASSYSFALWTSNTKKIIQDFLCKENIEKAFVKIIAFEDVQFPKPDPEGFEKIYDRSIYMKNDYLMIGDSTSDEEAAKAAGIDYYQDNYFSHH